VDFTDNKLITNVTPYTIIKSCTNLYALSLCACTSLTDAAFLVLSPIEEQQAKTYAQGLQNLNLSSIPVSDASLHNIGNVCHKLSALDLFSNGHVTDNGLESILKGCLGLKRLYLQFCRLLTDATLANINKYSRMLEFLDIYGCDLITSEGASSVIVHCKNLREYNVGTKVVTALIEFKKEKEKDKEVPHPHILTMHIVSQEVAQM